MTGGTTLFRFEDPEVSFNPLQELGLAPRGGVLLRAVIIGQRIGPIVRARVRCRECAKMGNSPVPTSQL